MSIHDVAWDFLAAMFVEVMSASNWKHCEDQQKEITAFLFLSKAKP